MRHRAPLVAVQAEAAQALVEGGEQVLAGAALAVRPRRLTPVSTPPDSLPPIQGIHPSAVDREPTHKTEEEVVQGDLVGPVVLPGRHE